MAIDLDGDGIETVGIPATGSPILFDHDADGTRTGTGWLKGDDAWLVMDRNGNGVIDSGRELFGVDTLITVTEAIPGTSQTQTITRNARTGFEALATLDANGDRAFNASDAAFTQVRLWRDVNQDGISQSSELFTLGSLGITSISLNPTTPTNTNLGNGNTVTGQASVTRANGGTTVIDSVDLQAGNLELADNPFYRQFADTVPLTAAAKALPAMGGSGWVRDLREAMSLGSTAAQTLTQAVATFAAGSTRDQQRAVLDTVIDGWAQSTGRVDTNGFRPMTRTVLSDDGASRVVRYTAADPDKYPNPSTQVVDGAALQLPSNYYETVVQPGMPFPVQVLNAAGREVMRRLGALEAFNGARFISFTETESVGSNSSAGQGSGGGGGGGSGAVQMNGYRTRWAINVAAQQIDSINAAYDALSNSVYGALVMQTRLQPYLDAVSLTIDANGIAFDTSGLGAKLDTARQTDSRNALIDLVELNRYATPSLQAVGFDGLSKLGTWVQEATGNASLQAELKALGVFSGATATGTGSDDIYVGDAAGNTFNAGSGDDLLDGGAGGDYLSGGEGNDLIKGGIGNDTLYGVDGNDTLDGGSGNDYLSGGEGADVYLFGKGSGQDTISNYDSEAVGTNADTILLGAGIATTGVTLTRYGDNLVVSLNGSDDSLTVQNYFNADGTAGYVVENLKFADGTVWDVAAIKTKVLVATADNDTLYGYATADTLNAGSGNDTVYGKAGDDVLDGGTGADYLMGDDGNDTLRGGIGADTLFGGTGNDSLQGNENNDTLYGVDGNDTLDGGAGGDYLSGGEGADVYLFGKGSGQDTINNYDSEAVGTNADTILLGAGIATTGVTLTRYGDNLVIGLNGSDDSLTVQSYFNADGASGYVVESLKFADGTVWDVAAIKTKVLVATGDNDTLYGYATADTLNAGGGNDTVYGKAGDDVLDGGTGADYLMGDDGNDTLKGGTGADTLSGGNGNDSLQGNENNDTLYGADGNDTLDGGAGGDYLSGGEGADVYLFGKGSGQDTINNYDSEAVGTNADTILLGAGIATTGVTLTRYGDNLVIGLNGSDDSLTVQSYFNADGASGYVVESLKFADGTVWDVAAIKTKVLVATGDNDTLYGYATADTLNAGGGNDTVYGKAGDDVLDGGTGADYLMGDDGNDTLKGGTGADTLSGGNGNDSLQGNENNDTLYGADGNDTLDGGAGGDYLSGGEGADVYLFGKGSGQDTINNYDSEAVGTNADTILLGAGIATTGVTLTRYGDNLVIGLNGSDDSLTVQSYFNADGASGYVVESLKFADGTVWDVAAIKTKVLIATGDNDTLYGYATADTLNAGGGNDTVYGKAGDDVLDGGTGADYLMGDEGNDLVKGGIGKDTLYGNEGNDTLDGGAGDDYLTGGMGADLYLFGKGSGQDTISNYDGEAVGTNADTILLGAGITTTGVTLTRYSDNLVIALNGSDDSLTVQNYFNADGTAGYMVENLKFADGTVWNYGTVKANLSTATSPAGVTVSGTAASENLTGGLGNDAVYGQAGNDTLDGGAGNDYLDGGAGNDTYLFGKGSGKDIINAYDSTAAKLDMIQLGAGIATKDVALRREGNDLLLSINGSTDTLRVHNYFYNDATYGYQVEQIKFADGTSWDVSAVKTKVLTATNENDTLTGYATADAISSLAGDDTVYAFAGNDTLDGGAGEDQLYGEDGDDLIRGGTQNDRLDGGNGADNLQGQDGSDTLYGQAGNDTLDGGAGNDLLDGSAGNDTYLFGKGSGKDTVSAYDSTAGKLDVFQLGAGIDANQLWFRQVGSDLEISIIGTADKATVQNWYLGNQYHVEQFKTSDGKTLLDSKVQHLVSAMASFAPPAMGQTTLPSNYQTTLLPAIAADWGP